MRLEIFTEDINFIYFLLDLFQTFKIIMLNGFSLINSKNIFD